jgi:hypothetical protein
VLVFCNSCRHQADADLRALVLTDRGDVPLTELRFRCSQCGSDRQMISRRIISPAGRWRGH